MRGIRRRWIIRWVFFSPFPSHGAGHILWYDNDGDCIKHQADWLFCHYTDPGVLVVGNELAREREPVNSDGETGWYCCCVEGCGDLCGRWGVDLVVFELDFLGVLQWICGGWREEGEDEGEELKERRQGKETEGWRGKKEEDDCIVLLVMTDTRILRLRFLFLVRETGVDLCPCILLLRLCLLLLSWLVQCCCSFRSYDGFMILVGVPSDKSWSGLI